MTKPAVIDKVPFWASEDNNWHIGKGVFYIYDPASQWNNKFDSYYGLKRGDIHGLESHSLKHFREFMPRKTMLTPAGKPDEDMVIVEEVVEKVVAALSKLGYNEVYVQDKPRKDKETGEEVYCPLIRKMSIKDPLFEEYLFCGLDWIQDRIALGKPVSDDELEILDSASLILQVYERELNAFIEENKDAKVISDKNFPDENDLLDHLFDCYKKRKAVRFHIVRKDGLYEVLYNVGDTRYTSISVKEGQRGTFMRMEKQQARRSFRRNLLRWSSISSRKEVSNFIDNYSFNTNQLTLQYQNFISICQAARDGFEESPLDRDWETKKIPSE